MHRSNRCIVTPSLSRFQNGTKRTVNTVENCLVRENCHHDDQLHLEGTIMDTIYLRPLENYPIPKASGVVKSCYCEMEKRLMCT